MSERSRDALDGGVASETRALLESAVRKLGPERAQQALAAYADGQDTGPYGAWVRCALSRAYGGTGELHAVIMAAAEDEADTHPDVWHVAAAAVGISPDEAEVFARSFDGCAPIGGHAGRITIQHRELLRELLGAEAAKMTSPRATHAEPQLQNSELAPESLTAERAS